MSPTDDLGARPIADSTSHSTHHWLGPAPHAHIHSHVASAVLSSAIVLFPLPVLSPDPPQHEPSVPDRVYRRAPGTVCLLALRHSRLARTLGRCSILQAQEIFDRSRRLGMSGFGSMA